MREAAILGLTLVNLSARFHARGGLFFRVNSGKVQSVDGRWIQLAPPGTADIIGSVAGRFVAVECKTVRGQQRETQKAFQDAVERAGGIYLIARDPDAVCDDLEMALNAAKAA